MNRLRNHNISSNGLITLVQSLQSIDSNLVSIDLYGNKLNDDCMTCIGELIRNKKSLQNVLLGKNDISDAGIVVIGEYLIGNTTMKWIGLQDNLKITEQSLPILSEIAKRSHVNRIGLQNTSISEEMQMEMSILTAIKEDMREIPIYSNSKSAAKIS